MVGISEALEAGMGVLFCQKEHTFTFSRKRLATWFSIESPYPFTLLWIENQDYRSDSQTISKSLEFAIPPQFEDQRISKQQVEQRVSRQCQIQYTNMA